MAYFPAGGEISVWHDPLTREDYEGIMHLERCVRSQDNAEWWEGQFVEDEFGGPIPYEHRYKVTRKLVKS